MKKIPYAPVIPNLEINGKPALYPVVNERAVKATAGIMFALALGTVIYTKMSGDATYMLILVPLFWFDFIIKTLITPRWSIFGFFGKFLVKKQKPEYVGAIQKRFAWAIGLVISSIMMIIFVWLGVRGNVPLIFCGMCLTFMWLESAAGICVGCKIYTKLVKIAVIEETEIKPACPGGVCSLD